MKTRYIILFAIIIIYLATIAIMLAFFAPEASKSKHTPTATTAGTVTPTSTPTSTATETVSPSPTPSSTTTAYASNCEEDKHDIQAALDAYYDDHTGWPTADGWSGDIIWSELVPEYMSEMPLIDSSCDWQVSAILEGQVCVAHTC